MKIKLAVVVLALAAACLMTGPMFAHHASSNYDRVHPITLTGTVTEFEFANPHVLVHFEVKDDNGVVTSWTAQSGPPRSLFRAGWTRKSLQPGDSITVTGYPSRDGKKSMSVRNLKPPKGSELTVGAD